MRLLGLSVFVFLTCFSGSAVAAEGMYAGAFGGLHINNQGSSFDYGNGMQLKDSYDTGFAGGAFVGYRSSNDFRAEFEIAYRTNSIETVRNRNTTAEVDGQGELYGVSFMGNVYRDLRWEDSSFVPYLGLGLGFMRMEYENETTGFTTANSSDEVLAYQVMAGVSYEWTEQTSLFAEYRYFGTQQPKFTNDASVTFEGELQAHMTSLGVRWMF
ncbi:Uncharacterized protein SCG7109_AD_00200 [Chlamydiales bacterium SCGC AG-110-M15]|nr:Uncharacterized protein SCG7109_AD_00200 [Chlamydiales bacterium SCGC AG-110-M15]